MNSSQLFNYTTFIYLLSAIFYIGLLVFQQKKVGLIGLVLAGLGLLIQTAGLGLRWHESYQIGYGHAPLTNLYESLLFFAWSMTLFYILLEFKFKVRVLGALVMPLAVAAMAYSSFSATINQDISPLIPALQSNWLLAHVITCFIGYGAFAVAAGIGVLYLLKHFAVQRKLPQSNPLAALPELPVLDDLTHKTIIFGFMWLTAGIITGAVWANEAWGTYWSWDPKETWSIITWFVYALALHARFTRGWNGTRIAWLAILGFLSVLFTYFGVNFVLSGLHSYGSS
ncbi:MAG: c-type cytochrome biogenesis protein CcsB [Candidatus Electrothrix sp. EH2]|nr:c-type cytochrome biogenesis protein CcsB [Candidatus Electrothrix sp. EH2]